MKNKNFLIYGIFSAIGFLVFGILSTYIRNTSRNFDIGVFLGFLIGSFEMLLIIIILKYFEKRGETK